MLARITGTLEHIEEGKAVVAPEGLGLAWEILLPRFLADELVDQAGRTITLHTRELLDSTTQGSSFTPRILGFASVEDRRFFELFTSVKGVGARKALRAMAAPVSQIARAIVDEDARALQKLPEIGKRLAESIVLELKDKATPWAGASAGASAARLEAKPVASGAAAQAVGALLRLGETEPDAQRLVQRAIDGGADPESADALLAAAFASRPD